MMPNPTVNAANILTNNKTTWGQNGSASPERTTLKYVSMAPSHRHAGKHPADLPGLPFTDAVRGRNAAPVQFVCDAP
jgi:hypothetical protein